MTEPDIWDVDRLAAADLLQALRAAREEEWPGLAATVLARHRRQAAEWAAGRVHRAAIEALESSSAEQFPRRDAIWADGFRSAEQRLCACTPLDLLGSPAGPTRSRGQVLRGLIRAAKTRHGST